MNTFPPLRDIEATPVQHEGATHICLSDPMGYADDQLVLSPPAFFVAAHFDGESDLESIQAAFQEQYPGGVVSEAQIQEISEYLDSQGYLDSPAFHARRNAIDEAFRKATARPAHFADQAYPADPEALRAFIDGFFSLDDGPGPLEAPRDMAAPPCAGIVAPHIDFIRGGSAYAHAYAALHAGGRPDTVIVFGVAHAPTGDPFVICRKDFETPLGTLHCDHDAVAALADGCDWDPLAAEAIHRCEHSIEFQAVMLAYLYGPDVRIVPVLCGPFPVTRGAEGTALHGGVSAFLDRCAALVGDASRRVAVVAGADLAHVGRHFGDNEDADDELRARTAARDHEDLAHLARLDADGWYASVFRDDNARRVCGANCVYAATRAMAGRSRAARLLHYDAAPDPADGLVTFASLVAH